MACKGLRNTILGDWAVFAVPLASPAKAFGVAHIEPVGRFIHGAMESLGIYKGLQEKHRMSQNSAASPLAALFRHSDRMREAKLGTWQSGRIRKRLLLVTKCRRSY